MNKAPTISLIIPIYNTDKWLRRCLDSVLAQNFSDFEVLLVDDGSLDQSAAICDEYAVYDNRFRVWHERNKGSSLARKFGMEQAKGEWFVFLDSDDDIHPDYLQRLYDAVLNYKTELAVCDMQRVPNNANPIEEKEQQLMLLDQNQLHKCFFQYRYWGFGGGIYHRSSFKDIYFPPYNINEDYVVKAQLYSRVEAVAYVPNALYHYRANEQGQSHIRLSPRIMEEYYNKKWVLDYYKQNNPLYINQAKNQLIETCVKLLCIIQHNDKNKKYTKEKQVLKHFLTSNLSFIVFQSNLLWKIKVIALLRVLK